ncbi:MAG: hypothetical protein JWR26_4117 [Pedosphaera sp.]|nr:hypothetical protein [Pedosphaera sp.]
MDPLGERLVTVFNEFGVSAKAKIKIRYAGAEVEADVLAIVENHLFAFECKNSLHPCNTYELRQSYDYILKAAAQLDNFRRLFADNKFRRFVSNVAGFDVTRCVGFTTCIVTGNRMFSGHREAGHAVRNIHELENVIAGGGLVLAPFPEDPNEPKGAEIRVRVPSWAGEKIAASDLVEYIERDSWHVPAFKAMDFYDEVVAFGKRTLRMKSFMLDVGLYRDLMRQHPQAQETKNFK